MDSLFGSDAQQNPSQSVSGFGALPSDLQNVFSSLGASVKPLINDPASYFAPMDLTQQEQLAGQLTMQPFTDPAAFGATLSNIISPFSDVVTKELNREFEGIFNASNAAASQAGAFGGSRQRDAMADIERARTEALSSALINPAMQTMQTGIGNLLGFGGLERQIDLGQSQALPAGLQAASSILAPLLGGSTSTGAYTTNAEQGLVGDAAQIAQLGATLASFSDRRLKKNIERVGESHGLNLYVYEYLWSPQKWIGFMADEVEKVKPEAIGESMGYKTVDYGVFA